MGSSVPLTNIFQRGNHQPVKTWWTWVKKMVKDWGSGGFLWIGEEYDDDWGKNMKKTWWRIGRYWWIVSVDAPETGARDEDRGNATLVSGGGLSTNWVILDFNRNYLPRISSPSQLIGIFHDIPTESFNHFSRFQWEYLQSPARLSDWRVKYGDMRHANVHYR